MPNQDPAPLNDETTAMAPVPQRTSIVPTPEGSGPGTQSTELLQELAGSSTETAEAASATEAAPSPEPTKPTRRRGLLLAGAAGVLLLALGGAGTAYATHYQDRALPGTTILGTDVEGYDRAQITDLVSQRAQATTIEVTGDVTASVPLTELGVTVDAEATADAALEPNRSVLNRFRALLKDTDVPVVSTTDDEKATAYAATLTPKDAHTPVDAAVVPDASGAAFTTTPATAGQVLDGAPLAQAASAAAASLTSGAVTLSYSEQEPTVTDAEAKAAAAQANSLLGQDVTIASADGKHSYTASASDKVMWVTVATDETGTPTVTVDPTMVAEWVSVQAEEAKVKEVVGRRNVNAAGETVGVSRKAVAGSTVSNAETLTTEITSAVTSSTAYSGTFTMQAGEEKWEDRQVAAGAENLPYQAAEGEKWIDINLSSRKVTMYEGATAIHGPVTIVDGAPETPTITGTFAVERKYESKTMRGKNADGTPYVTENVPYASYFYGGYALHGAPWRSSFGYSGSHGCINMPVSEAKTLYQWAELGTVVVSHR